MADQVTPTHPTPAVVGKAERTGGEHTPGEKWEVHEGEDYIVVMSPDQTTDNALARVDTIEHAHLIAAAPDLLAACEEFVRKVESGEARSKRSYEQMKAALAKARPPQP
jgi:hypothetical protein